MRAPKAKPAALAIAKVRKREENFLVCSVIFIDGEVLLLKKKWVLYVHTKIIGTQLSYFDPGFIL